MHEADGETKAFRLLAFSVRHPPLDMFSIANQYVNNSTSSLFHYAASSIRHVPSEKRKISFQFTSIPQVRL